MQVAIVGAGLAGLGMGIMLRRAGIDDFEISERAHELGGTWRANSYPGCCVDVQSHLYSYSFAPNPDWTHVYAPQAEIWAYARRCAERFGVLGSLRCGHEVLAAVWDDERERWLVTTTAGAVVARYLVSAVGPLSAQALPDIPGLDSFQGAASFCGVGSRSRSRRRACRRWRRSCGCGCGARFRRPRCGAS